MRIGFISLSFRPLEINWKEDYEMVKLGAPTVMGYLYRGGQKDLKHWDFDAQICEALETDPDAFDLKAYFDKPRVMAFIEGRDDSLGAQTEKMLDTLGVIERDVFGLSLSAVLDRVATVMAIASLAQALAVVLKRRYPTCKVVLGGLQASPDTLHAQIYRQLMEECPALDYAFISMGDEVAVQFFRNIEQNRHDRMAEISRVVYRGTGPDGSPVILIGRGNELDHDLESTSVDRKTHHHPAHTKSGAAIRAQEIATMCEQQQIDTATATILSPGTLVRLKKPESAPSAPPAHADDVDVANEDVPYDNLPARVPYFDPELVDRFRYSGLQIMKRFHFDKEKLLRFSRYENNRIVVLPHIFVRGCNAPCGFCSYAYSRIEGEDAIETVEGLKWLSEMYDCRHFHFLNTQINSVYKYAEAFCDAILATRLEILWSDCANLRALDERLLEKMRRAGAMRLVFGVESPEDQMLKQINKGVDCAKIERLIRCSHDLGIWNHVLLIAGMPHETKPKQDRIMDFLVRTASAIDFYSVSSFYLIASSPWGRDPEKFGIERISDPSRHLEEQAFNEIKTSRWESDGLKWPEKKQQIIESTQRFYSTISSAKGQSRCVGGNIDLYLLMFLYSVLGHDKKDEIVKIYTETAQSVGSDSLQNTPAAEENALRVRVPVVVGRMNEGDQSSLAHLNVDLVVAPRAENQPHFIATPGYTFAYRLVRTPESEQFAKNTMAPVKENLPVVMSTLGRVLTPFAEAVERKLKPQTAAEMVQCLRKNLFRYPAWTNHGYKVVNDSGRTVMDRTLQWSGLV